jgi:hypothetical protein
VATSLDAQTYRDRAWELYAQFEELKNSFEWKAGETFLTDKTIVGALLVGYVLFSFFLQWIMTNRPAFKLTGMSSGLLFPQ